ncbi:transcriptional regulator [Acinetobacter lwoffii]|uniref:transcriptional regulator n=1 Tax=Acinetobacter lwoffii TaxID=28090 RepID=UPI003F912373
MTIKPIRVQFKTACELLDVSRESLRHIIRTDETFPHVLKMGKAKQAPVYFDYAELLEWHNKKKQNIVTEEAQR